MARYGLTKKDKLERFDAMARESGLFERAYWDAAAGEINWFATAKDPEEPRSQYKFGLSSVDSSMGGILHIRYRYTGSTQRDTYRCHYLDEYLAKFDAQRQICSQWYLTANDAMLQARRIQREALNVAA